MSLSFPPRSRTKPALIEAKLTAGMTTCRLGRLAENPFRHRASERFPWSGSRSRISALHSHIEGLGRLFIGADRVSNGKGERAKERGSYEILCAGGFHRSSIRFRT